MKKLKLEKEIISNLETKNVMGGNVERTNGTRCEICEQTVKGCPSGQCNATSPTPPVEYDTMRDCVSKANPCIPW